MKDEEILNPHLLSKTGLCTVMLLLSDLKSNMTRHQRLLHIYAVHLFYTRYIEMVTQCKHIYITLIYIKI